MANAIGAVSTLASLCLAFGVAYLLLDPFHFRDSIRVYAAGVLNDLDFDKGALDEYKDREYYRRLMVLAGKQNGAGEINIPTLLRAVLAGVDRVLAGAIIWLSLFGVIALGCLQSFTRAEFDLGQWASIPSCLIFSVSLLCVTCMAFIGGRVVTQATESADECKVELTGFMKPSGGLGS